MADCRKIIRRLAFRITALLFLKDAVHWFTGWCLFWGTLVLVCRAVFGVPRLPLVWGVAALVPIVLLASLLAIRRRPSDASVRAFLDSRIRAGGLLMASEELKMGKWEEQIPEAITPHVRWQSSRSWALLGIGVVFVIASFAVPRRVVSVHVTHALEIGEEANNLAAKIEILEEEQIIESTRAESLKEKLEQIQTEATGEDPVKTWEALDHLESAVAKMAKEAAETQLAETEELTKAEVLAESLLNSSDEMDAEILARAMKELAGMVVKAAQESELLEKQLAEELLDACQKASKAGGKEYFLTAEDIKNITEALGECKQGIAEGLRELCDAGLIDIDAVKFNEMLGDIDSEDLAAFLQDNAGEMAISEMLDIWCREKPGKGGVDRGRGDAPMTWSEGTSEEGAEFKEQTLSTSAMAALKDSKLRGVSAAAPTVRKAGAPKRGGALRGVTAGGGEAHTRTVLPRHKGTVERYFQRD